jgi:[ribosomal protein S5]-alanine N-acetyltransferase
VTHARVELCTTRAVLRPFVVDDAPHAHPVFANKEVMRFAAGDPDADLPATIRRLERYIEIQAEYGCFKWAVWERETGPYLGDAGLTVVSETGEVELGYRLDRQHWGRGLATEVARAWLRHALDELNIPRIIAFADPRNLASVRVMEKIGMRFDREDHLAGMACIVYASGTGSRLRNGQLSR